MRTGHTGMIFIYFIEFASSHVISDDCIGWLRSTVSMAACIAHILRRYSECPQDSSIQPIAALPLSFHLSLAVYSKYENEYSRSHTMYIMSASAHRQLCQHVWCTGCTLCTYTYSIRVKVSSLVNALCGTQNQPHQVPHTNVTHGCRSDIRGLHKPLLRTELHPCASQITCLPISCHFRKRCML